MIHSLVVDIVHHYKSRLSRLLFRGVQPVDLMVPLVAGFGNNHNSLDFVSNLNSSRSDWVLVYATRKLSVLRQKDMRKEWTFNAGPIHRFEAPHGASAPIHLELRWLSVAAMKTYSISVKSIMYLKSCCMRHSQPAAGHFNDDGILDLFIQSSENGVMQVKQKAPSSGRVNK